MNKTPQFSYSADLLMGGIRSGLTRSVITVDSPIEIATLSPEGQAALQAFIARSAADDIQTARGVALSGAEQERLQARVATLLAQAP